MGGKIDGSKDFF